MIEKNATHVLGSAVAKNLLATFSLNHTIKEAQDCAVILDTECGMSKNTSLGPVRDSRFAGNVHASPRYIEGMVYSHSQRKWERALLDLQGGKQSAKLGETQSRALPTPTALLFATSACCSRTGINCSHQCKCSRKEV